MKVTTLALIATVVWSTLPLKSHLDYRHYNRKLHHVVRMEARHIPVTRVSDINYFQSNHKIRRKGADVQIRPTSTNPRSKSWKLNNRKFHKK